MFCHCIPHTSIFPTSHIKSLLSTAWLQNQWHIFQVFLIIIPHSKEWFFCIDYDRLTSVPSKPQNCHGLTQQKFISCSHDCNVGPQWYICMLGVGEIGVRGIVLYTNHLNILAFIGFPLLTDGFQFHLGTDNQIVDGKVLWEAQQWSPSLLFTLHQTELNHMATSNCKGAWKV